MHRLHRASALALLLVTASAPATLAGADAPSRPGEFPWDAAFADRSGNTPIHFVAQYTDARNQPHRLEEWRLGRTHLRRLTDARIDLHADAAIAPRASQPADYTWQILDLQAHIAHRISTAAMLRLGMPYSFYGMAHGLTRPAGDVHIHALPGQQPATWQGRSVQWFQVDSPGQPSQRIAWLPTLGVPLEIQQGSGTSFTTTFRLQSLETRPIAPQTFAVSIAGFRVRDADETVGAED